ncbi:hypothetical protein F8388_019274 [Cannabis sativa]|uniref:Zinc knuckle CX2CX4HX4C domain-containing protein n=1 Tax=Cannabis sativa TaxID=3483 RepID=A0A7J6FR26_CANSA|nr:hypothetical protein F8388_019274 [Cannabis sativa]
MKVQVDIDFAKPLTSGCYFDLANGEKRWIQFKFERIGIFCYKCGPVSSFARGALASASGKYFRDVTLLKAVDGVAGVGLKVNARRSRRTTMMVTSLSHANANSEKPVQAVWHPKTVPDVTVQAIATSGNRSEEGHLLGEKAPEKIPVLAIEGSYRASIVR